MKQVRKQRSDCSKEERKQPSSLCHHLRLYRAACQNAASHTESQRHESTAILWKTFQHQNRNFHDCAPNVSPKLRKPCGRGLIASGSWLYEGGLLLSSRHPSSTIKRLGQPRSVSDSGTQRAASDTLVRKLSEPGLSFGNLGRLTFASETWVRNYHARFQACVPCPTPKTLKRARACPTSPLNPCRLIPKP